MFLEEIINQTLIFLKRHLTIDLYLCTDQTISVYVVSFNTNLEIDNAQPVEASKLNNITIYF